MIPEAAFVVRDGGRWLLARSPDETPEPLGTDALLALVGDAPAEAPAATDGPAPADRDRVAPVWCRVGRLRPGGVEVEGADGRALLLRGADLRLLDAVADGATVSEVRTRAREVDDVPARLGRLVAAACLRVPGQGESPAPVAGAEIPAADAVDVLPAAEALARARAGAPGRPDGGRVPVFAVWQERVGPALSLGMLTASLRAWDDGALARRYDIRRPETGAQALWALAAHRGPA
ncbi:MAG: hypothetical protein KDB10_23585, partial [Acidimicrobiales bacterium]|nr:hypothetical protein [Acidimicrobiales bacterium]